MYHLIELIALALLAGYILMRLRSVLGEKGGLDRENPPTIWHNPEDNPENQSEEMGKVDQDHEKIVPLRKGQTIIINSSRSISTSQELIETNVGLRNVFEILKNEDPTFDLHHFITGAKEAFSLIVTAYAQDNLAKVKQFISSEVLKSFTTAIKERNKLKEKLDITVLDHQEAEIIDGREKDGLIYLDVQFTTEQIITTTNNQGQIIDNPAQLSRSITEIWTFSRPHISKDPNWLLESISHPEDADN